jgi:ABC-type dipeptide/oligopeptide/nickel transport system permease subunit
MRAGEAKRYRGRVGSPPFRGPRQASRPSIVESFMNNIIYIVGAIVIVLAILAFLGLG